MSKRKYQNPIAKMEKVSIPVWEYASLVRASTIVDMTDRLVNGLDEYKVRDALKVLYGEWKEEE